MILFSDLISNLGTGIGSLLPAFMKAFLDGFVSLFFVKGTGEGAGITGLSTVGEVALVFIVLGIAYKFIPTIVGWLRLKTRKGGKRRSRRAA